MRIGSLIIFHLSEQWKAKFFIQCDVIFWRGCRRNLTLITLGSERVISTAMCYKPHSLLRIGYALFSKVTAPEKKTKNSPMFRDSSPGSQSARRSVIRMLVIVVVLFATCWFPYHVVFFYIEYTATASGPSPAIVRVVYFVQWFAFANSACNPLVYAVLNLNYRREFVRILRCQSLAMAKYLESMNGRAHEVSGNYASATYRGTTSQSVSVTTRLTNHRPGRNGRLSLETVKEENVGVRMPMVSFSDTGKSSPDNECAYESGL